MLKITILLKANATAERDTLIGQRADAAGAIVARLARVDGALRYAQYHRLPAHNPIASAGDASFDGAEEYWFTNLPAARSFFAYLDAAALADSSAIDVSGCREIAGTVYPIWDVEPSPTKVLVVSNRKPGLSVDQFRHHWIDVHGPLAMANPEGRDIRSRVEYCPADALRITGLPLGDFDGAGAIHFKGDPAVLSGLMTTSYYRDVLAPDELRFADPARSSAMVVGEHQAWGHLPAAIL